MSIRLSRIPEETLKELAHKARYRLDDFAALIGCSLRQLERVFHEIYHQSPSHWLRHVRLERSKELLEQGYSDVAIVIDLYFSSASQFCSQFKQAYGLTPQQYAFLHRIAKAAPNATKKLTAAFHASFSPNTRTKPKKAVPTVNEEPSIKSRAKAAKNATSRPETR